jgi:Fe-Mn family superoxide dismutase
MSYITVQDLEYDYNALEPHIDEATMRVHHDKHYATYVSKYNDAVKGTEFENSPLHEVLADGASKVPQDIRQTVINNGGGAHNHAHFWEMMAPPGKGGGGEPVGELAEAINKTFGSFSEFKDKFKAAALGQFGSGWAWLVKDGSELKVTSTKNQDSPILHGQMPILGLDVWEHAYYLNYQNKRPDYVDAFWNVVNWPYINERFGRAD